MPQHHKLCFVIADGGHARFAQPAEDNALHTIETMDSSTVHAHTHDLVSDRPGRSHESGSPTRHSVTARTDPHERAQMHFADNVARHVNQQAAAGAFNELVLVAPNDVLAVLEAALDTTSRPMLRGTLAKDLVKTPDHELWRHLRQWVRPTHRA